MTRGHDFQVTCSGWQSASAPLKYTVTSSSDISTSPLAIARDVDVGVLNGSIVFFFPDSGTLLTAKLTVAVEDSAGRITTFPIATSVEVKPLVPVTGNAAENFNAAVDAIDKEVATILNGNERFKEKMDKIMALVGTLKNRYSAATGIQLRRHRRAVRTAIDSLLASFSNVMSNIMKAVTTEATKSGVDLTNTENAGALVSFFSSVAPIAAKTGAVSEVTAVQGATLLLNVIKANPALVRVYKNSSSFPAPPAGYRLVASILDVTATGLDDTGRARQLSSEFSSGVSFTIPVASGVTIAAGQAVSLVFFNATSKAWEVCASATASSGAYTATCNHLTPFSLMSPSSNATSNANINVISMPYCPGLSAGRCTSFRIQMIHMLLLLGVTVALLFGRQH
eukprot:tig00021439_g21462.t1